MKKGFTLVELLAVIVILSLLIIITGLGVSKLLKSTKNELNDVERAAIISAAEIWSADNLDEIEKYDCTYIQVQDLIGQGILSGELKSFNKNSELKYVYVKICGEVHNGGNLGELSYEIYDPNDYVDCYQTETIDNNIKIIGDNSYYISGDSSCPVNIVLPSIIDGKKVTVIGDGAFQHISLESVVIPNVIETIEDSAFSDNFITKLKIPSSVKTIEDNVFDSNYLTSVTIDAHESEVSLGNNVFGWENGYSDSDIRWLKDE